MSIARMKKVSIIGHSKIRAQLMEELMSLGVVQISAPEEKLGDGTWKDLVTSDGNEGSVSRYDNWIGRVNQALEALEKFGVAKKPLFKERKPVKRAAFDEAMLNRHTIEKEVEHVVHLANQLNQISATQNKVEAGRLSLLPWKEHDIPLEFGGTRDTDSILGSLPVAADYLQLQQDLEARTDRAILTLVSSDAEQHYLSLLCMKDERADLDEILKNYGFNRTQFGDVRGTAEKLIADYENTLRALTAEKEDVIQAIQAEEEKREAFQYLHDHLAMKRNQAHVRSKLLITKETFYLDGWMPRAVAGQVEALLVQHECYYEIRDPKKGEETPVLLLNGRISAPFEAITKLYALPDSRGIDATPFFSLSYIIFFGMMLSDAAYGLIMAGATFFILKKYRLEGMARQLMTMFLYCGISTVIFGALFGSWFGDIVTVVARTFFDAHVVIPPLWFNPMEDPMKLLIFCFILGGIHLFLGMGLNAYLSIKDGRPFDAIFDIGFWYLLLIGAVLLLTGIAPIVGQWMAIAGAVGILITGGRNKKGIGKITGGLGSLYGITSYLSDVLSYSRLLALGLATGVIASVVNTMGSLAGGGIVGVFVMLVAFVIGHSYNMAINALGSFVHSSRLEYVEFFSKFYESGGETFEPFREPTKYIEILREEKK